MQVQNENWKNWAHYLQQNHLLGLIKFFLEASGPIKIIVANSIWMFQPFLQSSILPQIGNILEDKEQSTAFLEFINNKGLDE